MENNSEDEKRDIRYTGERNQDQEISITQLLGIVKQRRVWIYVFFVLAVAAAFVYLHFTNPTYNASATALVEPISNATSIESLLTTSTSSSKIDTEVQLITSTTNLQNALDRLDLTKYTDPDGVKYSDRNLKGASFSKKVSVKTVSSTKVISLTVEDGNPQFCADFANAILDAYTDMLTKIAKNSKSAQREFLEMQIPETEALLEEASLRLSDYKEQSGITQMTEKSKLLTAKIASFQLLTEPLKLQLIESENLMSGLNPDGKLPSLAEVSELPAIRKLTDEYIANNKELIMYQNVESSEGSSRIYVLENTLAAKEKEVLNAVTAHVGAENQAYAKALTDHICVTAAIDSIQSVISLFDEELADFPLMERKLLEYTRDVEIYQSLLLSLRQLLEETKMVEAAVVGNVNIIDSAVTPDHPVAPRKVMILAIAVVGGVVLGVLFGLFLEFTDDSIRSEDSVHQIFGRDLPSLGWTPYIKDIDKVGLEYPALFVLNDPEANVSERFRSIANNIVYSIPKKLQVLSINSSDMSEGKTTIICNVAASYALTGKKVLLIDGDFRKPAIEPFFNLKRSKVGFVDAVVKGLPLEQCIVRPVAKIPNLHLLPPGMGTRNPNALYNSEKFGEVLDKLKTVYDYIIIDCPPLSYGSEFTHLAKHLDGFVLNIRAGVSSKKALSSLAVDLEFIKAPLLGYIYYGVVAKNQSSYSHYGSYSSYGYGKGHYGYGYGYGRHYGYGYGSEHKTIYKEGSGSYRKLHIQELKRRKSVTYGKREPVLAFAEGAENAFVSTLKMEFGNEASQAKAKPVIKPVSTAEQKTSDMLADIEKIYRK